jgi:hypothetical protein
VIPEKRREEKRREQESNRVVERDLYTWRLKVQRVRELKSGTVRREFERQSVREFQRDRTRENEWLYAYIKKKNLCTMMRTVGRETDTR